MALIDNCIAYYKCDDSGNFDDATSSGWDGTRSGVTYTSSGKIGGAYDYDGTNDKVEIDQNDMGYDYITYAAWVNHSGSWTSYTTQKVVEGGSGSSSTSSRGQFLEIRSSPLVRFRTGSVDLGSDTTNADYAGSLSAGWHLLIGSYDGTTAKVYVDGVLRGTSTAVSGTINDWNLTAIGYRKWKDTGASGNDQYFDGLIDEIGVWTRALTDGSVYIGSTAGGELAELYNSGSGLQYPFSTPVGWDGEIFGIEPEKVFGSDVESVFGV